jgi:hypothetical protein
MSPFISNRELPVSAWAKWFRDRYGNLQTNRTDHVPLTGVCNTSCKESKNMHSFSLYLLPLMQIQRFTHPVASWLLVLGIRCSWICTDFTNRSPSNAIHQSPGLEWLELGHIRLGLWHFRCFKALKEQSVHRQQTSLYHDYGGRTFSVDVSSCRCRQVNSPFFEHDG